VIDGQRVHPAGLIVFVVTYVLISARRLPWLGFDRPASALFGAVACVALGVLTPQAALDAVDGNTILLLFGMMGLGAVLADDGFFAACADRAVDVAKTPARLLGLVVWGSGLLSALVTNDAVCVLAAPLVVTLIQRHRLPATPLLLALATGANTGSVATLVGNPQNMLCATLGGLDYRSHLVVVGPIAVAGLAINHALVWWRYRRVLRAASFAVDHRETTSFRASRASIAVVALTVVAATLGAPLPWCAVGGLVLVNLIKRADTSRVWPAIDWSVLVFFGGLFVVVAGFVHSGGPAWLFARLPLWTDAGWWRLSGLFLLGSNLVSNVPFILVIAAQMASLPNARLGWELLAVVSTFAGNLTLLGSVANIIVAEAGRDVGGLSFIEHLKVGLPLALISSVVGTAWLLAML
jgi:Na+/H+ antiporter NhaD/arsenite permease-like protein